ncbi:MAG TPA: hypothetical protein VFC02_22620 [Anaerolineales bacterium]|nr:hypothetical protein [Anaerolineales bacterium]
MEEIIQNKLTEDGFRHLKLISDSRVAEERMMRFIPVPAREHAQIRCSDTTALSLFYGEANWPVRGDAVDIHAEGWIKFRRLVVWKLLPGERMSEAIGLAKCSYIKLFLRCPRYAFARSLPKSVESGVEVDDVMLMQAEWAIPGCVMIGG